MSIVQLEDKLVELVSNQDNNEEFIYKLMEIYDFPKATITRLKKGNQNSAQEVTEVHLKNKLWYKSISLGDVFTGFSELENRVKELSSKPRYLIVTDYKEFLAKDMKTEETLDIEFKALPKYFDFFLAWKGIEKVDFEKENPADIKAAERFARLYDEIIKENPDLKSNDELNEFLVRVLFCLFAEDTDVFPKACFTNSLKTNTKEDGSDLNEFFVELFLKLSVKKYDGNNFNFKNFPYVGGDIFSKPHQRINFNSKIRKLIIDCGELLNWSKINPDILGSMIQAVATEENRSKLGMHYTSVPNIMKVIKPLFLDELYESFEKAYNNNEKLSKLYERIGKIKFFDPACGSGNFLIITYKELRRLEIKILQRQRELNPFVMYIPSVTLDQFYGIELNNFAHDIAKLSLWISEHQMNVELEELFQDKVRAILPLTSAGIIYCGNALSIDWEKVCKKNPEDEFYLFGNPPYLGSKRQNAQQKADLSSIFNDVKNCKMLDYIAGWFKLGSSFIANSKGKLAFVSTNSITQGEQVSILWPEIFSIGIDIMFAYNSFKWVNNAKNNAGVTVVIIGLKDSKNKQEKFLYNEISRQSVENISPYLTAGENVIVYPAKESISNLPKLNFGSMPNDNGYLILNKEEYVDFIDKNPGAERFIRKFVGSDEFINGDFRYCLWINEDDLSEAIKYQGIVERIEKVKEVRKNSKRTSTQKLALKPYSFGEVRHQNKLAIAIPAHSSENRDYIPMGISPENIILSNAIYAAYGAEVYVLGILISRMHMAWVKGVCGRLETRYRYTAGLCYNTFPIKSISPKNKTEITEATLKILDLREENGGNLATLYNPDTMPNDLKVAHNELDALIDGLYRSKKFMSDQERLEFLLHLYNQSTRK